MNGKQRQQRLAGFEDEPGSSVEGDPVPATPPRPDGRTTPVTSLHGQSVYVLDAHSLIYQVFHALPDMSGPSGQPVGAIHGFLRDVMDILDRRKPDYLLCAFDPPGPTFRHALYEPYKANRAEMPDDLQLQIPNILRFLAAMAIPVLSVAGYEADDVLATVARRTDQLGGDCYLVTNDKDCRQLINDRIKLYNIRKSEVVDAAAVEAQWGIRPDQVVDFQAMWGDSTDNVPGIPGIGQKTAAQLLAQYGTLEGIFAHVHEITRPKQRESIEQAKELVVMSRRLVRLADDVPLDMDWHAAHVGGMDVQAVLNLCAEFGFHSLPKRLTGLMVSSAPASWSTRYETVTTPARLATLVSTLSRQERIAVDTETTSTHARSAQLVGCSFAWQAGRAVYLPLRAPAGDPHLEMPAALAALRPILENPRIAKVGQNLKYDLIVLRNAGIHMQGTAFDTMVADYLLAPGERSHNMDDLAKRYLNYDTIKIRELIGTGKAQRQMDEVPVALVTDYAAQDADVPLRLSHILEQRLRQEHLDALFHTLEMPLVEVLAEMEFHGIRIDVPLLERLSHQYGQRMEALEAEIYQAAGAPFNIDSPKQLAKVLFDDLGLRVVKRTRTGPSTDVDVLSQLALEHTLPAKIIEYRQQAKLKSTYVDALPQLVHPETGRVHTSFKQDVAATGRLSSTDPNLQNIPVRTRDGREIRAAFVPGEPDWQLLCADYSQIELRVSAHFSQDATLLRAFADDRDIHAQVASQVNGVPLELVTPEQRRAAKAVNFGIIYGQSAFGLATALSIEKAEAAAFIDKYFNQYPGVEAFMNLILADCWQNGYVSTVLGRRRAIQGVRDPAARDGTRQRNLPERIAINTVIQGSAADLIKQAMIQVHHRLRHDQLRWRMLLQIHDELVFEVCPGELDRVSTLVVEEMAGVGKLSVPLKVDVKAGELGGVRASRVVQRAMAKTMVVIGVTGGIASGKSLVAQQLGRLGAEVLEADQIGHAVLWDPAVRAALHARWGAGVLDAAGEICRSAVAEKVFAPPPDGPRELAFLEQVTHPRIAAHLHDRLHALAQQGDVPVVVLDAALLYKAGWDAYCRIVVYVDADPAVRAVRARQRGWSDQQWQAREAAQPALTSQRARADVVLDNSGTREQLMAQVEKFWQSLQADRSSTNFRERPFPNAPEKP